MVGYEVPSEGKEEMGDDVDDDDGMRRRVDENVGLSRMIRKADDVGSAC